MKKIISIICLISSLAVAGDLTTDNLTVNQDAVFYGGVDITAMNTTTNSLTNGLALYYDFSTNTTPVADLSGNNNTGTVSGATWISQGWTNGAYSFDGDDTITAGCNSTLQLGTWTLACWFKLDTTNPPGQNAMNLISRGVHLENWRNYQVCYMVNRIYGMYEDVYGSAATAEWSTSIIPSNTWIHTAYTYDGTQTVLYVNGVAESSNTQSITPRTNQTDDVKIGNYPEYPMYGTIDEPRIYNRALSAVEIAALYGTVNSNAGHLSVVSLAVSNGLSQTQSGMTNCFMGKVGIGTNVPGQALSVKGNVEVTGTNIVQAISLAGQVTTNWNAFATAAQGIKADTAMQAADWANGSGGSSTNIVDYAKYSDESGCSYYIGYYPYLFLPPESIGSSGHVLATDGSGNTYWTNSLPTGASDFSMGIYTNAP